MKSGIAIIVGKVEARHDEELPAGREVCVFSRSAITCYYLLSTTLLQQHYEEETIDHSLQRCDVEQVGSSVFTVTRSSMPGV